MLVCCILHLPQSYAACRTEPAQLETSCMQCCQGHTASHLVKPALKMCLGVEHRHDVLQAAKRQARAAQSFGRALPPEPGMPRNIHKRKGGGARRTDYYGAPLLAPACLATNTKVSGSCSSLPNRLGAGHKVWRVVDEIYR